jgi:hypothetical protein
MEKEKKLTRTDRELTPCCICGEEKHRFQWHCKTCGKHTYNNYCCGNTPSDAKATECNIPDCCKCSQCSEPTYNHIHCLKCGKSLPVIFDSDNGINHPPRRCHECGTDETKKLGRTCMCQTCGRKNHANWVCGRRKDLFANVWSKCDYHRCAYYTCNTCGKVSRWADPHHHKRCNGILCHDRSYSILSHEKHLIVNGKCSTRIDGMTILQWAHNQNHPFISQLPRELMNMIQQFAALR